MMPGRQRGRKGRNSFSNKAGEILPAPQPSESTYPHCCCFSVNPPPSTFYLTHTLPSPSGDIPVTILQEPPTPGGKTHLHT